MADLPTNLKIKHVLRSNAFPILFLYFVVIPRTVTRAVIDFSTPRFQSVSTFQARKENNRSFTRQAPCRSKIISRELRAIVEERGFSFKAIKSSSKQTVYDLLPVYVGSTE